MGQRARSPSRRTLWLAGGLGVLLLAAMALALVGYQQIRGAERQARLAEGRELAAAALDNLEVDPELSILLALRAAELTRDVDWTTVPEVANALHQGIARSHVAGELEVANERGSELLTLTGHDDEVWGVTYSPDGSYLATASRDGQVRVWDAATGDPVATLDHHDPVGGDLAFSPDGNRLISAADTARVWDLASGEELFALEYPSVIMSVDYSPDGMLLATGHADGRANLWDAATGEHLHRLDGHLERLNTVAFGPEGARLATTSQDGTAKVWDVASGEELFTLEGHNAPVGPVAFGPDAERLATAGEDQTVRVWDLQTGEELHRLEGHTDLVWGLAFSPDGKQLASASEDGTARVWSVETGEELQALRHGDTVWRVEYSPDGSLLATAGFDGVARLWGTSARSFDSAQDKLSAGPEAGRELLALTSHSDGVVGATFRPDGRHLATASFDGTARVYTLQTEELMELARERLTRTWTVEECQQYLRLPPGECPLEPGD